MAPTARSESPKRRSRSFYEEYPTVKIQPRTKRILGRIVEHECRVLYEVYRSGIGAGSMTFEEFVRSGRKVPMTEILHRAVVSDARRIGVDCS